jgi:N2227-like protein
MGPFIQFKQLNDVLRMFTYSLPSSQNISSYIPTLFRDWSHSSNENAKALEAVAGVWPTEHQDAVAVWGSGGSRLAYDLIRKYHLTNVFICDLSPILLTVAKKMFKGESLHFYEFPLNAVHDKSYVLERTLAAPEALPLQSPNSFILCDLTQPVFSPHSFSAVLTPWFIDIVSDPFEVMIQKINHALRIGGHWVNYGPLVFNQNNILHHHTLEEIIEIATANGFQLQQKNILQVPYLSCAESGQLRTEQVVALSMKKIADGPMPKYGLSMPNWLNDKNQSVPLDGPLKDKVLQTFSESQVFGRIDGKKSIAQIAAELSAALRITPAQAEYIIKNLLVQCVLT